MKTAAPPPTLLAINNYYYPRGGAEVLFLEQNRLLEQTGWDVVPFAMRHPNNLETPWDRFFPDEIEFGRDYGLGQKLINAQRVIYSTQARSQMRKLLDEVRPTVAHAHNIYHHLSPSILPLLHKRGIPLVLTVHDLKLGCPAYTMMLEGKPCDRCKGGKIYNVAANRCIKGSLAMSGLIMAESYLHRWMNIYGANVDAFVVPSRYVLETLVDWGWPREKFVHIPNFVDIERFRPDEPIGKRFVYCGRLDQLKGVETLIRAAARARQPLTLAGRGPDEARYRELAKSLGGDIEFLGHIGKSDLSRVLQSARAIVVPSECNENAPLAALEAYAAGRPVIGARIAGIPELVREDETGSLFKSGDEAALASELDRFGSMADSKLGSMGRAGRAWIEEQFTAPVYRDRLIELYRTLGRHA